MKRYKNTYNGFAFGGGKTILAPSANIVFVDIKRLVDEVITNPSVYFTPNQIQGTHANQGFFDNTSRPTNYAHQLIANYVTSILEAPSRVALMRELPINNRSSCNKSYCSIIK
jgi:phospholipase/lecithinase/hemolysin